MPDFTVKVYQIRLRQTMLGQNIVNIFYYKDDETGPAVGLSAVTTAFNDLVLPAVFDIQSFEVEGVDLRTRLLGGGVEDVISLAGQFGARVGDAQPSFNAYGFKLIRTNINIRNGSKRFAGVAEADTDGNNPTPEMDGILADVATALAETLILTNSAELTPVIFRQDSFIDPDWFGSIVAGASFQKLTSQVSRKFKLE